MTSTHITYRQWLIGSLLIAREGSPVRYESPFEEQIHTIAAKADKIIAIEQETRDSQPPTP